MKKNSHHHSLFILSLAIILWCLFSWGCSTNKEQASGPVSISVWFHTGRPAEQQVMEDQAARFNTSQKEIAIALTMIPEGDYNTQVQAAAADGKLPDLLDMDGPFLANYAWRGHLAPLDGMVSDELKNDLLPSIIAQGTYNGKLYALGTFDSGLGLYGNRQLLEAVGARLPRKPEEAWNRTEFQKILGDLAARDSDGMVLDLRMDYSGEWYTYAFSPVIQSAGGDLINRAGYQSAQGVLNGEQAVGAMREIQSWFAKGYVAPNTDANSFTGGRVALSWCGHWEFPRYQKALGEKLVLLPLPDMGQGSKTGMGSWCWAIPKKSNHKKEAMAFLKFLLTKNEVLAMSGANGAVPATYSAIAGSDLYGPGGKLNLFVRQLQESAVPRPVTPAYPVITSAFQEAFLDIKNGAGVKATLDKAVGIIDQDIRDNEGYRSVY